MHANPKRGLAFDDEDVARAYVHRPPYPEELYLFLRSLPQYRRKALDLGCGPGKIAHRLALDFDNVEAVDPSEAMLSVAPEDGRQSNITWIHGTGESFDPSGPYDLITAGASIHWMDHATIFPKLAASLDSAGYMAVIDGDDPHDPPWSEAWDEFLRRWLHRLGRDYNPARFDGWMASYRPWLDIAGSQTFDGRFSQTVDSFIECQHSRATWSRTNLGPGLVAAFDADLRDLLTPHAIDGSLTYKTRTEIVWGTPRPHASTR